MKPASTVSLVLTTIAATTLALVAFATTPGSNNNRSTADGSFAAPVSFPFPQIADTRHATADVSRFFHDYFSAKSRHDFATTMSHFSPELLTYTDATLGWPLDSYDAVRALFAQYMPTWPESGISYPTRILGGEGSALVAFTDTPELFGGELRILGAVDFKDGKVVRWVDYWDATSFDAKSYASMRTPEAKFPADFKDAAVGENASSAMRDVAARLHRAFAAGDVRAASELFSNDAIYEDMALRTQLLGRAAIERYLARVIVKAPFATGSKLRHVVGNDRGGGFEWIGSPNTAVKAGITALELDADAKITRLTTVYDGRELSSAERSALVRLSLEETQP